MWRGTAEPKLALVLGGGGSKGALHAGLYRALTEVGLRPDLVVGASVGAVNGAYIAAGMGPRVLARGWESLSRKEIFAFQWSVLWRGLAADGLLSPRRLRDLLRRTLPAREFADLPLSLHVVTTHLGTGEACIWERGDLVEALLASTAIPGLLPPVSGEEGVLHVDGSLADNVPVEVAFRLGATHVVAMNCRTCDRCRRTTTGLVDVIGQAFSVAADCKLRMADGYVGDRRVLFLEADMGEDVRALDFSRGRELVQAGYDAALPRLQEWALTLPPRLAPRVPVRDPARGQGRPEVRGRPGPAA